MHLSPPSTWFSSVGRRRSPGRIKTNPKTIAKLFWIPSPFFSCRHHILGANA
jgi:hypothetical protein